MHAIFRVSQAIADLLVDIIVQHGSMSHANVTISSPFWLTGKVGEPFGELVTPR
jgi:hypothetical protein